VVREVQEIGSGVVKNFSEAINGINLNVKDNNITPRRYGWEKL
jgi:hypothetical protein